MAWGDNDEELGAGAAVADRWGAADEVVTGGAWGQADEEVAPAEWTSGYGVIGAAAPSDSQLVDAKRRFEASTAENTARVGSAMLKIGQDIDEATGGVISGAVRTATGGAVDPTALNNRANEWLQERAEVQRTDRGVNPAFDDTTTAKLATAAGSLPPVIVGSMINPFVGAAAGGGIMAESERAEAEERGATEAQQDTTFYTNAAVGAITEKLLGVTKLWNAARKAAIPTETYKGLVRNVVEGAARGYLREGTQETLEQTAANEIAKTIAGWDPERARTTGLAESFLIGGALGAPIGAAAQASGTQPRPKAATTTLKTLADLPDIGTPAAPEAETSNVQRSTSNVQVEPQFQPDPEVSRLIAESTTPAPTAAPVIPTEVEESLAASAPIAPATPPPAAPIPASSTLDVGRSTLDVSQSATQSKRVTKRSFNLPHAPIGAPDIIDVIVENGGIVSRRAAPAESQSAFDDQPDVRGVYRQIFNGSQMPDRLAAIAAQEGFGDGSVSSFWGEVDRAVQQRRSLRAQVIRGNRDARTAATRSRQFSAEVLKPAKAKTEINTANLAVGDQLTVEGHALRVTDIDPTTLDVTLEDGKRYGVQTVVDGQALYVDRAELTPRDQDVWLAEGEGETSNVQRSTSNVQLPTLRAGERQGDLLSTQSEDLALVGEHGLDWQAVADQQMLTEQELLAARASQEAAQGNFEYGRQSGGALPPQVPRDAARPDRIKTAAIRYPDGRIFEGDYHSHAMDVAYHTTGEPVHEDAEHGFVTESGQFLFPDEAARFAKLNRSRLDADDLGEVYRQYDAEDAAAASQFGRAGIDRAEGGAFGGAGGIRTRVRPIRGLTPKGDPNFLHIPRALQRVLHGLEREGAADVIARSPNKVAQTLAKMIRRHVDTEQEIYGKFATMLQRPLQGKGKREIRAAFDELSVHLAARENGRTPPPLADPLAQKLLTAWEDIAEQTGQLAAAHNVQVFDPGTGGHRPIALLGRSYVPRMFRPEVERVMRDPNRDATLWNDLVTALATHRSITPEEAANELRAHSGRFAANDFMGNIEMARQTALPEIFYDYDLSQLAFRYIPRFSERMSQIISYGQRLGPRDAPNRPNLWDVARDEAGDTYTQEWLRAAEDQAVNLRSTNAAAQVGRALQTLASGLLLSSPTTSVVRNTLSGNASTYELLGMRRALVPMVQAAISARNRMTAREVGAVRADIGDMLHNDQLGDSIIEDVIRDITNTALEFSGYNGSEVFVRSHCAITSASFAREGVAAINAKPTSGRAKEALAMFKRMNVDAAAIVAEGGDWRTGPETRKFIRTFIRETQGGYRFDQVPLWANSSTGRFFYQFGRWGTQRARNIWRNGLRPAFGEEIEWHGKKMRRHDFAPLIRMGASTVLLGETFALVAAAFFDRDRKDASLSEIRAEWDLGHQGPAIALALERMLNDVIMAGTLGIWGQPVDWARSLKDQSRFKHPAEPPSLASVKALGGFIQATIDQGGVPPRSDWENAFTKLVPGVEQLVDVARNVFDEPLYEAQNDVRTLRQSALRWGKANLLDVPPPPRGEFRKSPMAQHYEPIKDALLVGDAVKAKTLAIEFLTAQGDNANALKSLRSSINGSQPFRVGPYRSDEYKANFYPWAKKNLSTDDFNQAWRVQERYIKAAEAAGLWTAE